MDLIESERRAFEGLYPDASIEVRAGTSREAMSALFGAQCDLAVVARELETEEKDAAIDADLKLQGYRFARDALVVVVHEGNAVENISVQDLQSIYRGEIRRWDALGGRRAPIVPVVQPVESDLTQFLVDEVLGGRVPEVRAVTAANDSGVLAAVAREPDAIGYVSLAGADRGAKSLRVAPLTGLSYWKPDLEAVYKGEYPLTRYETLFVRADGARLAHGFITYVTSSDGQRRVHESGLVPTTVPVRFVRRSPMHSTHEP